MGITVKSINKNGNKIVDYVCDKDGTELRLTRDELIDKINSKEVDNARIQVYKGQVIIRVNTGKTNGTSKANDTTKSKDKKDSGETKSSEVLLEIATKFNINNIEAYSRFFFENNPSMKDRLYTDQNLSERVSDMREMVRFCRLVALKQVGDTYEQYNIDLDNVEFFDYCKKNNIEIKEE